MVYPTGARYARNAADFLELRVTVTDTDVVYRVTLNTVREEDAAVVGIGLDTDCTGDNVETWPREAGITSQGLDKFITAWGTGGEATSYDVAGDPVDPLPGGAVSMDTERNQMTIRVPRALRGGDFDPRPGGTAYRSWCHVAGVGLWDSGLLRWKPAPAGESPGADTPASGGPRSAPGVFNLAFRFDEQDSITKMPGGDPQRPSTTFPGTGSWFEFQQARALAAGTTAKGFRSRVEFEKVMTGVDQAVNGPRRVQARIFASAIEPFEGVQSSNPTFGGRLQPYLLVVPPGLPARPGLTFSLHSLGGNYTQYLEYSPTQLRQFGDERANLVVTPLSRSQSGFYQNTSELDFFEVWADVARHFDLDSERVALTGYSMGGYGAYKLAAEYPDLFGRAFTAVGPPSSGSEPTGPLLENVRWVPFLNWAQAVDELVPYPGPRGQQDRFTQLGLRSQLWTFATGEHLTLAILDEWGPARDHLGEGSVKRDPWRVDYVFQPQNDRPELGLVHDHAYWVSGLRARDASGSNRGRIAARSLAFGVGDPRTSAVTTAGAIVPGGNLPDGTPIPGSNPYTADGIAWGPEANRRPENTLELDLANLGSGTVDGRRARLDGAVPLRVKLASDGAGALRLEAPLPAGTTVRRIDGNEPQLAPEVALDTDGATFAVATGKRDYLFSPPPGAGTGPGDGGSPGGGSGGGSPSGGSPSGGSPGGAFGEVFPLPPGAKDTFSPTVRLVAPRLASDRFRSGRMRLRFLGSDVGTGITRFAFQVRELGARTGKYRTLTKARRQTALRFNGRPGKTYQFRLRGIDRVGNVSRAVSRTTIVPLDDRVKSARFRGFRQQASPFAWLGTYQRGRTRSQSLSFAYRGRDFYLVGLKSRLGGRALVTFDGRSRVIDTYSPKTIDRARLLHVRAKPTRLHRVTVRPLHKKRAASHGFNVRIDALGILRRR